MEHILNDRNVGLAGVLSCLLNSQVMSRIDIKRMRFIIGIAR